MSALVNIIIIQSPKKSAMYEIIDGLFFIAGIAGFILCFTENRPQFCPIPIVWIVVYPIINQIVYNIFSSFCGQKTIYDVTLNSRIAYHPSYNLSFCGIQKLHPFDSRKYANTFARLLQMGVVKGEDSVIRPNIPSRKLLLQKMSMWYLFKMNYSLAVCSYIEMPLCFIPGFLLRWRVLNPMLLATQGTILASVAALKLKWAINLSGGYHHASCSSGGGFCIYPDITLAAHYMQTRFSLQRIMIIDLDAHQGNGHERDHLNRTDIFIVDAYNHHIYPGDSYAQQAISQDISVTYSTSDQQYIKRISAIQGTILSFQPNFVIYNAGTDCLVGDPLGNLSISEKGIILRDQTIFRICIKNNVPVVMVLSGGYQKINAKVIAQSIQNLHSKFDR